MPSKKVNAGFSGAKVKAKLADLAGSAVSNSPVDFGTMIAEETRNGAR